MTTLPLDVSDVPGDKATPLRGRRRFGPIVFLLVFTPVSAEYLIGYDTIAGNMTAMVFGLVIFAPLYGAPALLIRELACRRGGGWSRLLLLGTAFGLIQAGLIDQGLFNPDYRQISYWDTMRDPTYLGALGTSGFMLFHFTAPHAFGSVFAPVTLAESISGSGRDRPWLRTPGLVLTVLVWLAAAGYVAYDHVRLEGWQAGPAQEAGVLLLAGLLVLAALRPSPPATATLGRRVPVPVVVAGAGLVLLVPRPLLAALSPAGPQWNAWLPTLVAAAMVAAWVYFMSWWSRYSSAWTQRHELAAAAGYLFAVAGAAFLVTPLGDVDPAAKYTGNVVLLTLVAVVVAWGWVAQSRADRTR